MMPKLTRRTVLRTGAWAAAATALPRSLGAQPVSTRARLDVVVVGAGVFGAWTAKRLQDEGYQVLLIDAWGPAHARASSGGESRMTRGSYGADRIYTRMALDSLDDWGALSARSGLPVFHEIGVLFMFPRAEPFLEETMRVHQSMDLPTRLLDSAELRQRFPQIDFTGIEAGLLEPGFGALMARRAVQTLVAEFMRDGGLYRQARVRPPAARQAPLDQVAISDEEVYRADNFVFACGPWLGRLFPDVLGDRIFPTRQEVFFFAPAPGDVRYEPEHLPGWADFNGGDIYYGFPNLEGRGFKIAHDAHGPRMDPDIGDRTPSPQALADVRAFMARRFPDLATRPLSEARVCQYENSSNGDLLIDRHPAWSNVVLVGAGSGHGFKHGPAVGRYAAGLVLDRALTPEPRFSLASKGAVAARAVH